MKFSLQQYNLFFSIALWVAVAGCVVWGNGLFGNAITLRWNNPSQPSTVFSWNQSSTKKTVFGYGITQLIRDKPVTFSVRLPRGYAHGTLVVQFSDTNNVFTVSGARHDGRQDAHEYRQTARIPIRWAEYVHHDRIYSFTVTILSPWLEPGSGELESISVLLQP